MGARWEAVAVFLAVAGLVVFSFFLSLPIPFYSVHRSLVVDYVANNGVFFGKGGGKGCLLADIRQQAKHAASCSGAPRAATS